MCRFAHNLNTYVCNTKQFTLILAAPSPCTDFQLASESMVTSSIGVELNVFNIAQMYWSISSPSVNAGLLLEHKSRRIEKRKFGF